MRKVFLGIFYCLSATLLLNSCSEKVEEQPEEIRPVKIITASFSNETLIDGFPGVSQGLSNSELSFRIDGPVTKFDVEVGQRFQKGQVIAQLDKRDYEIDLQAKQARYDQLLAENKRYASLLQKGSVSQNAYDQIVAQLAEANSQLMNAKNRLSDATITAPYDGVITKKSIENYDQVRAKQPIVDFENLSGIKIKFYISEYLSIDTKSYESFKVTFNAYPNKSFKAKLLEIGRVSENAGYPVILLLDKSDIPDDLQINAGMSCIIQITKKQVGNNNSVIGVPISSVFEQQTDNHASVWIVDANNTVQKQAITIINFLSNDMLAVDGIKEGDRIVTAGTNRLVEGQSVKIFSGEL